MKLIGYFLLKAWATMFDPRNSVGGCTDTLISSDYKDPMIVAYKKPLEVLVFKERAGKPGGGKGILITEDKSFTLSTLTDEAVCYAYDPRGNGGGGITPTITGDHQNRITDYTAIVVYGGKEPSKTMQNAIPQPDSQNTLKPCQR